MSERYDAIIVGLGAMGSATLYQLARRGYRALGIDRFTPPHDLGSSHGATRIIREAYFEHPLYVPLVRRAFELWRELEHESDHESEGRRLLIRNGGLFIGSPDSALVRGALASATEHGVPHDVFGPAQMRERYPDYHMEEGWVAVYEPGAGLLRPEAVIDAHLSFARGRGARTLFDCPVTSWHARDGSAVVETAQRGYEASTLVLSAGAWTSSLIGEVAPLLRIERQTSHWFAPADSAARVTPGAMPVSMWELEDARFFYTTPDLGLGVKASFHHGGEITTPDTVRRVVSPAETAEVREMLQSLMPAAAGVPRGATVCLYTDTPDEHFLLDRHPRHSNVIVVSACSGHGFKFSAAIGEVAADLVEGRAPRFDVAPFALTRPGMREFSAGRV